MQALRRAGRGRLSDLARSLGLSTRTVKRRMIQLVDGNAFYLDPILDLGKVGGVRCRFWVTTEASWKQSVDKTILSRLQRIIWTHTTPQEYSLFIAHLSNLSELEERLLWMRQLAGVREVRLTIEVEHIHVQEWLEGEIEKQLSTRAN